MNIAIGSDHGGFDLKERIKTVLTEQGHRVVDCGCFDKQSVDYPEFAAAVAAKVSNGSADRGIAVCTSGIGVSISANRFPGVRAALCVNAYMAEMSRRHNNANVLALGQSLMDEEAALRLLDVWMQTEFDGGRHERRVNKIESEASARGGVAPALRQDPEVYKALTSEQKRQEETLDLIASESFSSRAVREATASCLTHKYASGYPGRRDYPGCRFVDEIERLAIDRAKMLFDAEHANVQAYGGAAANLAVMMCALKPGDTILSMAPSAGGHFTHGAPEHFSGQWYTVAHYGVDPDTEWLNYADIEKQANACKPRLIICGASCYSRIIDFKKLRAIADGCGAMLLADIAHIAGLVAAGCHPNPAPHCEFVTLTTHKSLRGPRGGMILCQKRFAEDLDRWVSPGLQGGPLTGTLAAKAICFGEALQPSFKQYQEQVVRNAQALAGALEERGYRMVSGGTDNHMVLVDLSKRASLPRDIEPALERCGLLVNGLTLPTASDAGPALRLGTYAVTARGMKEDVMGTVAELLDEALRRGSDKDAAADIAGRVATLCRS